MRLLDIAIGDFSTPSFNTFFSFSTGSERKNRIIMNLPKGKKTQMEAAAKYSGLFERLVNGEK